MRNCPEALRPADTWQETPDRFIGKCKRDNCGAAQSAEARELAEHILRSIQAFPEHERTATTLFYINGYSQNEVAEFLEVPVNTVKSRLHTARRRLKERMTHMVEVSLKNNAPDERFSQRMIESLLARARPLESKAIQFMPSGNAFESLCPSMK